MAIAAIGDVGKQIIDALGLEGKIRRITIVYDVGSEVTVEVERLLDTGGHERLVAVLQPQDWKFESVPVKEVECPEDDPSESLYQVQSIKGFPYEATQKIRAEAARTGGRVPPEIPEPTQDW